MQRIVLGYDGSDPAKHAAARAAEMAQRLDSRVVVLVVGEMVPGGYGGVEPVVDPSVYQNLVDEGVEEVRRAGAEAEGQLVWGSAAEELIRVAESDGCDMIVVGHRSHGGLRRFVMGSVASSVIDRAHCSVLVVR